MRIGGVDGAPSPNGGVLTPVGSLGLVAHSKVGGFDIEARTGAGFAAIEKRVSDVSGGTHLYTINLTTGAATEVGAIDDGATKVRGIAVALPTGLTVAVGGKSATFTDIDGDKVTVTTKGGGVLSAGQFTFGAASALGRQLLQFKVGLGQLRGCGAHVHRHAGRGEGRRLCRDRPHRCDGDRSREGDGRWRSRADRRGR